MIYFFKFLVDVIDFLEFILLVVIKYVSIGILICKIEFDFINDKITFMIIMCFYYSDVDNEFSFLVIIDEN